MFDGALARATFASDDPRAVPLYIRAGMTPLWTNFYLDGDAHRAARDAPGLRVRAALQGEGADLELAWDGADRSIDHEHWATTPEGDAFVVDDALGPAAIGYARGRQVGTSRVVDRLLLRPGADPVTTAMAAMRRAARDNPVLRVHVLGPNPLLPALLRGGVPDRGPRPVPGERPVARGPRPAPAEPGDALGRSAAAERGVATGERPQGLPRLGREAIRLADEPRVHARGVLDLQGVAAVARVEQDPGPAPVVGHPVRLERDERRHHDGPREEPVEVGGVEAVDEVVDPDLAAALQLGERLDDPQPRERVAGLGDHRRAGSGRRGSRPGAGGGRTGRARRSSARLRVERRAARPVGRRGLVGVAGSVGQLERDHRPVAGGHGIVRPGVVDELVRRRLVPEHLLLEAEQHAADGLAEGLLPLGRAHRGRL